MIILKKTIITTISIFIISALIHSFYNLIPNCITAIFFPINESIWEHMKMIYTAYMLLLLLKFTFKKLNQNDVIKYIIGALLNIILFLIIYLPIYILFGEHLIITLLIYLITIFIINILIKKIDNITINKNILKYAPLIIILIYIIFTILSYYPPHTKLFYDTISKSYGFNTKYN